MRKHKKATEYIGVKFGALTVIELADRKHWHKNHASVKCRCDCGNEKIIAMRSLVIGHSKSCGCLLINMNIARKTHGMYGTTEYNTWCGMKKRCNDINNEHYKYYGGRGITVCDKWNNSFQEFINDMGLKPSKKYSLDRINNNGNYEPSNCRWATATQQLNNRRESKNAILITHNGETHNLRRWSTILNINYGTLSCRLKKQKMTFEEAIQKR